MTDQEVFDTVSRHLLTQMERSVNANGMCAYRGKNGLKCAIGCLIPDERYDKSIEGFGIQTLMDMWAVGFGSIFKREVSSNLELLRVLQRIHDRFLPEQWSKELASLASEYGLSTEVFSEFSKDSAETLVDAPGSL